MTSVRVSVILIQVAAGEPLPVLQDQLTVNGHAFEARVYAEDPDSNFMPGAGPLQYLATPTPRSDLRIESGVRQGCWNLQCDTSYVYSSFCTTKLIAVQKKKNKQRKTITTWKTYC